MGAHPDDPATVRCHLCPNPDDTAIATRRGRAWWEAMDHLLDVHRAHALANKKAAQNSFTILTGGRLRALRPGDPTTRS